MKKEWERGMDFEELFVGRETSFWEEDSSDYYEDQYLDSLDEEEPEFAGFMKGYLENEEN